MFNLRAQGKGIDSMSGENDAREADRQDSSPLAGKRVVIIEDEGITQLQMRRALTKAGLKLVGVATTAREGRDVVLKERPDLVLMDITLSGDIDGLDAAEDILATYQVCIVVVTSYNNDELRWRAQDIGTCGYIVKPVPEEALLHELEKADLLWKARHA